MSQPTSLRPLNALLQKVAIRELHEVPERIADDLEALRTWIKQQPYLNARLDDQFLIAFLRGCKYSLERAKHKIDRFYTLRSKYPEFFNITDVDDPKLRDLINMGVLTYLPTPLNGSGPRIAFIRSVYSCDKFTMEDIVHIMQGIQEILMLDDDYAMVYGIVTVIDVKGGTAAHITHITPSGLKRMVVFMEEALPFRAKGTHFINVPNAFETFLNFFKSMLSKKISQRFFIHGSSKMNSFYKHIPLKYLPKEYGGENGSIEAGIVDLNQRLDAFRDYFKGNAQYGANEKLRPGKPIDLENMCGMQGSFRKLEVD